jgi:hypothetical protein
MSSTLKHLAEHCHGDERPECPILDGFAAGITSSTHKGPARFGVTGTDPDRGHAH